MIEQLSFLGLMRSPPVCVEVEPDGPVISLADIKETLILPHPKMAWHRARIQLHPHGNKWMWSTAYGLDGDDDYSGACYQVGAKWGKFAQTREDALHWACEELRERLKKRKSPTANKIRSWLEGLS